MCFQIFQENNAAFCRVELFLRKKKWFRSISGGHHTAMVRGSKNPMPTCSKLHRLLQWQPWEQKKLCKRFFLSSLPYFLHRLQRSRSNLIIEHIYLYSISVLCIHTLACAGVVMFVDSLFRWVSRPLHMRAQHVHPAPEIRYQQGWFSMC